MPASEGAGRYAGDPDDPDGDGVSGQEPSPGSRQDVAQDEAIGHRKMSHSAQLPSWLDHFNHRDVKIFLRCWIATWVATLLIFIQPALEHIGVATFFAALTLYIAPPAGILFVYLLSAASALLGMCLAWLWGLLAMKAALAARPASETLARLAALEQTAAQRASESGLSTSAEAGILIFNGSMLDARVTVVFYVMACVFVYALARLRMSYPKFTFTQIFGTIVIDVFLLYGPSLPTFNGSLPSVLVKPGAIGIGLGAASCLLLFPQSTSYTILDKMEGLLRACNSSIAATHRQFSRTPPSLASLNADRGKMIGIWKAMQPLVPLLSLDLFRCHWSAGDLTKLQELVRETMRKSLSLADFHIATLSTANKDEMARRYGAEHHHATTAPSDQTGDVRPGHHHLEKMAALIGALESPEQGALTERTTKVLKDNASDLLNICSESIDLLAQCMHTVNHCRWFKSLSKETVDDLYRECEGKLAALRSMRELCTDSTTEALLSAYDDQFDESGHLLSREDKHLSPMSLRGMVSSMVIEEHIREISHALEMLVQNIMVLLQTRTENRIWMPLTLQHAVSWLFTPRLSDTVLEKVATSHGNPVLSEANNISRGYRSSDNPHDQVHNLGRGGSSRRPYLIRAIISCYRWLTNTHGLYAIRIVIVTIATSIPAAIPSSAGFFYREKGIWAVITAQLTLLPYMADFVISIFSRAAGTLIGGILGMAAWYIGSGSGNGNPYGLGAITAVMTATLVWARIWSPHMFAVAGIMSGATFSLVVGFSYDNDHLYQYGLPGKGYEAFWKRVVTVFIGLLAAAIVQVFPTPPSAVKHASHTLANSVRTISDQYALLLLSQRHADESQLLRDRAEHISLELANSLFVLGSSIHALKVEMSFGPLDHSAIQEALKECRSLNQSLSRLLSVAGTLPTDLKQRFQTVTGILDDHVIGDIMAVLHIIQQSFQSGLPLPERLPTPLVRTFYDAWQLQRHVLLSKDLMRQESYCRYCVAISSYLKFLSSIDNLVFLLTQALGESHGLYGWEPESMA